MNGTVSQINVSGGGVPKHAVAEARVTATGVEGDGHAHPQFHGGARQAVLVIAAEVIDQLNALGFPVFPGALGENLTTRGLDCGAWRIGQRWRVGADAVIEFTKIRTSCQSLLVYGAGIHAAIHDAQVKAGDPSSPKWCWSGMYASVVTPGAIRPGDPVVAFD